MLRWSNTCRKCNTKWDVYCDLMAFGDLVNCDTCHEEMYVVAFNTEKIGNNLYRTVECDTRENYFIAKGMKGLDKHGVKLEDAKPLSDKAKKVIAKGVQTKIG